MGFEHCKLRTLISRVSNIAKTKAVPWGVKTNGLTEIPRLRHCVHADDPNDLADVPRHSSPDLAFPLLTVFGFFRVGVRKAPNMGDL